MTASRPLDIEHTPQLLAYLRDHGHIPANERPRFTTLNGGVSNRTVLVERPTGGAWVIKQALEKLRVKADWYSDPARVHREALGLRWLERITPVGTVPGFVFEDFDHHLLAMTAVDEPHENWKTMLLAGRLERRHAEQFGKLLGLIHRRGHEHREELSEAFADRSFFDALRLEPYYRYAARHTPEAADFMAELGDPERLPRLTLVHGDYSPKNVLVHADRLVLLDHEVIHFGDPAFDVGFALSHLLSKAHHLSRHRLAFKRGAVNFWRAYREALGDAPFGECLEPRAVCHALGCLLARVAGRSPLEYLSEAERARQRQAVVELMQAPPATVSDLARRFIGAITPRNRTGDAEG